MFPAQASLKMPTGSRGRSNIIFPVANAEPGARLSHTSVRPMSTSSVVLVARSSTRTRVPMMPFPRKPESSQAVAMRGGAQEVWFFNAGPPFVHVVQSLLFRVEKGLEKYCARFPSRQTGDKENATHESHESHCLALSSIHALGELQFAAAQADAASPIASDTTV